MPTLRTYIPLIDLTRDEETSIQSRISLNDKRTVLSAVGDDGIYTLIIRAAFKRAADYARQHGVTSYDRSTHEGFISFICNGADTCADRTPPIVNDGAAAKGVECKTSPTKSTTGSVGKSSKSGARKQRE